MSRVGVVSNRLERRLLDGQRPARISTESKVLDQKEKEMVTIYNNREGMEKAPFCGENYSCHTCSMPVAVVAGLKGSCLALPFALSDCATTELPTASQRLRCDASSVHTPGRRWFRLGRERKTTTMAVARCAVRA